MLTSTSARMFLRALLITVVSPLGMAWAQDSDLPARLYATEAIEASRWPGAVSVENPAALRADAGTALDVVFAEGELVRVRQGLTFGWAPRALLADAPAAAEGVKIELGGAPPSLR